MVINAVAFDHAVSIPPHTHTHTHTHSFLPLGVEHGRTGQQGFDHNDHEYDAKLTSLFITAPF